jgi:ribosome-associated toxin RatA of RatAB toxin-antitoxin module
MTIIKREALVARSPERLFALVNDVERYPEMYPWCRAVEIL